MVVRKIFPRRAIRAVVFADSAPLPFREVRPPALPMFFSQPCFFKALVFNGQKSWHTLHVLCDGLRLSCIVWLFDCAVDKMKMPIRTSLQPRIGCEPAGNVSSVSTSPKKNCPMQLQGVIREPDRIPHPRRESRQKIA